MNRSQVFRVFLGTLGVSLALWTVRSAWPDREQTDTHQRHLPIPGRKLFALTHTPGQPYLVKEAGVTCESDRVALDEELRCEGRRFFVRESRGRQVLVMEGLAIPFDTTVGSGRSADYTWPLSGLAAIAWRALPPDRCESGLAQQPIACIENLGGDGSLLVDRSLRQNPNNPLPATRTALRQGEIIALDERDLLWANQTPLRPRAENGLLLWSVPVQEWTTLGGDRRWMSLELPQWTLAANEANEVETFQFLSTHAAFRNSPFPLAWNTGLLERRVEYEQEEKLQSFIDHELLCYDADNHRMRWNLRTGKTCNGQPGLAPAASVVREAEQAAYQPGMTRIMEVTDSALQGLPEETPDPAAMVFVFDWVWEHTSEGDRRIPNRVTGVRPGATRNGPPTPKSTLPGSDDCELARHPHALPPFHVHSGSTSTFLEVTGGSTLAAGTRLLLPRSGAICLGAKVAPGLTRIEPAASAKLPPTAGTYTLGLLHLQPTKAGWLRWWSPEATLPPKSDACVQFNQSNGWTVQAAGDITQLRIGETLAEDRPIPLSDGQTLTIGPPEAAVELVFRGAEQPDLAAISQVQQREIRRLYPFGRDLSPLLGYGHVAGGIEGATERQRAQQIRERWIAETCEPADKSTSQPPQENLAWDLTIRGDIQRIVAGELASLAESCERGDPRCPLRGEGVTASAVLLDSRSGAVIAAASYPAFEPNDPEQVAAVQQALRTAGPTGIVRLPTLENRAFLRASNAGSAYKLATSYALGQAGILDDPGEPKGAFGCTRFAVYTQAPEAPFALQPGYTPDGTRSQPCGKRAVVLSDAATGFHDAFRYSINLYFGIAPFALLPPTGVSYSTPKMVSSLGDPLQSPTHGDAGLWLWQHGTSEAPRADLGLSIDPQFQVDQDFLKENPYLDTLVAVGHRYHYPRAGGGTLYTQTESGVGTTHYPTAEHPWLIGLQPKAGFRYPSLVGPEAYAFEGVSGWATRDLQLTLHRQNTKEERRFTSATSSVREYSRSAYGMGGIEASPLSLAVLATPIARADGSVVTPMIYEDALLPLGRLQSPGWLKHGREPIIAAMRAVVSEPGSTAHGYFSKEIAERIGGKTGTFEIVRGRTSASTPAAAALQRVTQYGCGMLGVAPKPEDWKNLKDRAARRSSRKRPEYLVKVLDHLGAHPPERGFAASADVCAQSNFNPGRPGVGESYFEVDAGLWLDTLSELLPVDEDEDHIEGSSFVAVLFDGLMDPEPGKSAPAKDWVLAVIMDGHPTGAKRASARILERLRQYALVQQGQGFE